MMLHRGDRPQRLARLEAREHFQAALRGAGFVYCDDGQDAYGEPEGKVTDAVVASRSELVTCCTSLIRRAVLASTEDGEEQGIGTHFV